VLSFVSAAVSIPLADEFTVRCVIQDRPEHRSRHLDIVLHHSWAPVGVARFEQMIAAHFLDGAPLYHVIPGLMAQFGASPRNSTNWPTIPHDLPPEPRIAFKKGTLSFMAGEDAASANDPNPDLRATELFISMGTDQEFGSNPWERPIGQVSEETLNVLDSLNTEYPPWELDLIEMGSDPGYLQREFPRLDHLDHCTIVPAVWAQFEHKIHDESVDNWWHMKMLAGIVAACIWARISWMRKTRAE